MNDKSPAPLSAVEICAGAGGQALGLHRAGFRHEIAVELDPTAAATLSANLPVKVAVGDVADPSVWSPRDFLGIDLLAGGVPCPPFSMAGKQLGSADERDLFAWAVEQVGVMQPRALLLENVRGLASPRFRAYRQRILDRLAEYGYLASWRLLQASGFGLAQLRPRFVLVALRPEEAAYFHWPEPRADSPTVASSLVDLMAANGWPFAEEWARLASGVGPTLVGGSKKHGGADLGPTRAKQAWARLGVDGGGVADSAPGRDAPHPSVKLPKLTLEMVARLQGWDEASEWTFSGRKTSQYRQIGNAFPPPVAEAVGRAIASALRHEGTRSNTAELESPTHDPVYTLLSKSNDFVHIGALEESTDSKPGPEEVESHLAVIARDFELEVKTTSSGTYYKLGPFKGFTGQGSHQRHEFMAKHKSKVS